MMRYFVFAAFLILLFSIGIKMTNSEIANHAEVEALYDKVHKTKCDEMGMSPLTVQSVRACININATKVVLVKIQ